MKAVLLTFFLCLPFFALSQNNDIESIFECYEVLTFDSKEVHQNLTRNRTQEVKISLGKWELILEESKLLSSDYKVLFSSGVKNIKTSHQAIPLKGETKEGGHVSLTIAPGFLQGFISIETELFYLEPLKNFDPKANRNKIIIYNSKDVKSSETINCAFEESRRTTKSIIQRKSENKQRSTGLCYDIEYAIVSDYSMFLKYGATGLLARNIAILNDVNNNYVSSFDNEIRFVLTGQYVSDCDSCDPWTSSLDFSTLLDDFRSWSNASISNANHPDFINNDIASLWSDRWENSQVVGQAFLGGLCTNNHYNILSDFSSNSNALRVLLAHELGHNLNASHDPPGTSSIMAPSINVTNFWSHNSKNAINSFVEAATCVSFCGDLPPTVYWDTPVLNLPETTAEINEELCIQGYKDYSIPLQITQIPTDIVEVGISTTSSQASEGSDFELLTPIVNFSPDSALSQTVTLRIYNDYVVENDEKIQLILNIITGTASPSSVSGLLINIISEDKLYSINESQGDTFFYGNSMQVPSTNGFFEGSRTDVRSRFLISADSLTAMGIQAGMIDMLSFFIYEKQSNGAFQNVRLGISNTALTTLVGAPWTTTSTVFVGNITTVESAWNAIEFTQPYLWDGSSNLYVELCYSNPTAIGDDKVVLYASGGNQEQLYGYSTNALSNCGTVSTEGWTFNRVPVLQLRQKIQEKVETWAINKASTFLKSGDKAVFISERNRVIATVENTGQIDLGCTEVSLRSEGIGRNNLDFGNGLHSDKSFRLTSESEGSYKLQMYFNESEHAVWDEETQTIRVVSSQNAITAAHIDSTDIIPINSVNIIPDLENAISYEVEEIGSKNLALTNWEEPIPNIQNEIAFTIENGGLKLMESGSGILLHNPLGERFALRLNSVGNLIFFKNNTIVPKSKLVGGDLLISQQEEKIELMNTPGLYTKLFFDTLGNLNRIQNATPSSINLTLNTTFLEISGWGNGIIMKNSDGQCVKLFVDTNGVMRTGYTSCN